jgi:hypothetical protein
MSMNPASLVVSNSPSSVHWVAPASAVAILVPDRLPDTAPDDDPKDAPTPDAMDVPVTDVQVRLTAVPEDESTIVETAPEDGESIFASQSGEATGAPR